MSRRTATRVLALTVTFATAIAAEPTRIAIKGYDPVAYFTLQRATPGLAQFEFEWDEHRWQFANARHRDLFKADPVRYAPQFANYCAVALARGEVREANPEYWLISDGKLYLFGKSVGPDLFRKDLNYNIERANEHRPVPSKRPAKQD
ncbi:MAG TPA: YHS domain-containing (seleno)protein [Steroidobacteraceae bacterium]|nr:YHS domain-containing (seleno)protein [Steroidobacteraceae bacterium]